MRLGKERSMHYAQVLTYLDMHAFILKLLAAED